MQRLLLGKDGLDVSCKVLYLLFYHQRYFCLGSATDLVQDSLEFFVEDFQRSRSVL